LIAALATIVLAGHAGVTMGASPATSLPGVNPTLAPLDGVYAVVRDGQQVPGPGGGMNQGSVEDIKPAASALVPVDKRASNLDPYGLCQPIGPFRMLAQPDLRIQLVAASNRLVVLFQDILHGYLRSFYLDRPHPQKVEGKWPWQGDSVAHWEADTLVVDTVGFDDRTWLNQHTKASDALHLVERIRPLDGGRFLVWQVTATDKKSLQAPYTYVRYFRRIDRRIEQDICTPHTTWTLDDGL
jgi:hypothetical protein